MFVAEVVLCSMSMEAGRSSFSVIATLTVRTLLGKRSPLQGNPCPM